MDSRFYTSVMKTIENNKQKLFEKINYLVVKEMPLDVQCEPNPFLFAYFNHKPEAKHIQLEDYLRLTKTEDNYKLLCGVILPMKSNDIIRLIAESDPRAIQKKLKLKSREDIEIIIPKIEEALDTIKKVDTQTYGQILNHLQAIILFDAAYSHNFSAIEYNGAIFFSPPDDATRLWYIDSLIHETSHLNLNLLLINLGDYFAIDPYAEAFSSPFRRKEVKRGLFHMIHALYVIANLVIFYDNFLSQINKDDDDYWETIGRFMLNLNFLHKGLEDIDYEPFYTKKGQPILRFLKKVDDFYAEKRKHLHSNYVLPCNSDNHIFDLNSFLEENDLK